MKQILALAITACTLSIMPIADADHNVGQLNAVGAEALRYCESTNNYQTDTGNGYYGAYQFDQTTWNATMHWLARDEYKDVRPNLAPNTLQDEAALYLWNHHPEGIGHKRWPVCSQRAIRAMQETPDKHVAPIPTFAG